MIAHELAAWTAAVVAYETGERAPLTRLLSTWWDRWEEEPTAGTFDDMCAIRVDVLRVYRLGAPCPRIVRRVFRAFTDPRLEGKWR